MQPETRTQKLFRLWRSPLTNREIAAELGISLSTLYTLSKQYKFPSRKRDVPPADNENPGPKDPRPEEIMARIAEVQADWSEEERLKRFQGKRRVAYITPSYEYDGRTAEFTGLD